MCGQDIKQECDDLKRQAQADLDLCGRVLYRASRDAWICGDDAEAERLADLALQTRLNGGA